eukprot:3611223-Amphidinium_carterae.1
MRSHLIAAGIITLAKRPWVQFSMESFLLGVDWEKVEVISDQSRYSKTHRSRNYVQVVSILEEGRQPRHHMR